MSDVGETEAQQREQQSTSPVGAERELSESGSENDKYFAGPGPSSVKELADPAELYRLDYGLSRSIRYCGKKRAYFDFLHRLSLFVTAIGGSSAFVAVFADNKELALWASAAAAIVAALDTVIGFSEKARLYDAQLRRYNEVLCELIESTPSASDLRAFQKKKLMIERDEPTTYSVLDITCRNDEDVARGYDYGSTIYIARFRRLLSQMIDIPPARWETVGERRDRLKARPSLWFRFTNRRAA